MSNPQRNATFNEKEFKVTPPSARSIARVGGLLVSSLLEKRHILCFAFRKGNAWVRADSRVPALPAFSAGGWDPQDARTSKNLCPTRLTPPAAPHISSNRSPEPSPPSATDPAVVERRRSAPSLAL